MALIGNEENKNLFEKEQDKITAKWQKILSVKIEQYSKRNIWYLLNHYLAISMESKIFNSNPFPDHKICIMQKVGIKIHHTVN